MQNAYPCVLTPEEGGGFSVSFPDVPEALTCGNNLTDALAMAEEALTAALAIYLQLDEDPPAPSPLRAGQHPVTLPAMAAAKLAIYSAMRLQGMTHAALAARLDTSERAVRQLLDLDHGSHTSEVEKALRVVGRDSMIEESVTQFPKV